MMHLLECSGLEYEKLVQKPLSVFDTVDYAKLNRHKADEVKHLVFNDGKHRFGLIAGVKDGVLKAPFSAPFSCFSNIHCDNKMQAYLLAVEALCDYAASHTLSRVRMTFPPTLYADDHICRFHNGFYNNGFHIAGYDVNYHFDLRRFGTTYIENLDPKARQKLKAALKADLTFEKTDDVETVYRIILANRTAKNYPLWMSLENVKETLRVVEADLFLVRDARGAPIASSLVYHVAPFIRLVVYWGNEPNTDFLKPMNFLAFHIFRHYSETEARIIDIGPSSHNSIPQFGLCDFKQSIGCEVTAKITFERSFAEPKAERHP